MKNMSYKIGNISRERNYKKKNQLQFLELKSTIPAMKISLERLNSRF